ncbi:uncharacterized protein LOC129586861 [Paramacrobiotus metropolitanus]|uniref:uncharacterized protein LOC129586861 n=1 Tax=Paramacrobiotus metropolitanus TaxID=2943436 RepID=UPI002445C91A|nr:uncharacterized protein LOC129586861 [Paramacrobiotus metropolitanus]
MVDGATGWQMDMCHSHAKANGMLVKGASGTTEVKVARVISAAKETSAVVKVAKETSPEAKVTLLVKVAKAEETADMAHLQEASEEEEEAVAATAAITAAANGTTVANGTTAVVKEASGITVVKVANGTITEELKPNCVFISDKRPKGHGTSAEKEKNKENGTSAEEIKETELEVSTSAVHENGTGAKEEQTTHTAYELAQMIKELNQAIRDKENGIPVTEAKRAQMSPKVKKAASLVASLQRSLGNGEEGPPPEKNERSLNAMLEEKEPERSVPKIDERSPETGEEGPPVEKSERSRNTAQANDCLEDEERDRSRARIRATRTNPRTAARNGRKSKEKNKPLPEKRKAKKLSACKDEGDDVSTEIEDEGVDERPIEKKSKGQALEANNSSESDSEFSSKSDNSTTSEDSGVSDLSDQEDLRDLDEDVEKNEEQEKEIIVRGVKVQRARIPERASKVYSDQRVKLRPNLATRVKVKMGGHVPRAQKLMYTVTPQKDNEVRPRTGVTDHNGTRFEIVIENRSKSRKTVRKGQFLGYVEHYEHLENVKVNSAGVVRNVFEDPEVDAKTKKELNDIIERLKLESDLTEEQKNDVRNAFWEFWKVLPTSKKPYGEVKGVTHTIDTADAKPVKCNPARTSWKVREFITSTSKRCCSKMSSSRPTRNGVSRSYWPQRKMATEL